MINNLQLEWKVSLFEVIPFKLIQNKNELSIEVKVCGEVLKNSNFNIVKNSLNKLINEVKRKQKFCLKAKYKNMIVCLISMIDLWF